MSWPTGLGELARQLVVVAAARRRWPDLRCHFVLDRHLPAAARARVPAGAGVTWLETSPTNDDAGVCDALAACRPDGVLFDNAGTAAQCRAARAQGARTVFLSTRAHTLARGFAPDCLPWLDEHWRVEPRALAAPLADEQRRRAVAHGMRVRSLQALFAPADPLRAAALRRRLGLATAPYVVLLPGGGGGAVDGTAAVAIFAAAAARLVAHVRVACVLLRRELPLDRRRHRRDRDRREGACNSTATCAGASGRGATSRRKRPSPCTSDGTAARRLTGKTGSSGYSLVRVRCTPTSLRPMRRRRATASSKYGAAAMIDAERTTPRERMSTIASLIVG